MDRIPFRATLLPYLLLLAQAPSAELPLYEAEMLGPGNLVLDMNESGDVVGWTIAGGMVRGYVAGPSHAFELLPLPPGYASSTADGINDAGVIVGAATPGLYPADYGEAVMWVPDGLGGYTVQMLGSVGGFLYSFATDVNNRGDVVGRAHSAGIGGASVWFNSPSGPLDVSSLGAPAQPKEINDQGVIIGIGQGLFDVDTLQPVALPPTPPAWSAFQGWAINAHGEVAGTAIHGSTKRSAAIYTHAGGWESVSGIYGFSSPVQAFDLNSDGVAMCEIFTPAVHVPGVPGTHAFESRLVPEQKGLWTFVYSQGGAVNDAGQLAATGYDLTNGTYGVVLLTPVGPTCQLDLGFQGPGGASLSMCGGDLSAGTSAELALTGAAPAQPLWLAVGATQHALPFQGGVLVPVPPILVASALTDASGEWRLTVHGSSVHQTLYAQAVVLDPGLSSGLAISNALQVVFAP